MAEPAQRWRRPSWRDPRVGIGVLLVAGSVALGSWTVGQADRTVDVLLSTAALTPGDRLADADLRPQAIRPDGLQDTYLPVDGELADDAVVTRVIGAGELVPAAAVGSAGQLELRPVVVPLDGPTPAGVDKGVVVDLWLTAASGIGVARDGQPVEPRLLVPDLIVAEVVESDSIFAGAGSAAHVLVPQAELPALLAALSGEETVVLVPVPGGSR